MRSFMSLCLLSLNLVVVCAAHADGWKESNGVPAPSSAHQIYAALDVSETKTSDNGVGSSYTLTKAVGGLTCTRSTPMVAHPIMSFDCSVVLDGRDDQAIYEALSVPEVNVTSRRMAGSVTFQKSVGTLVCSKSQAVVYHPVPSYLCKLK